MHLLNTEETEQLVALYEAGESLCSLGRRFKVHEQTVRIHLKRLGVTLRAQNVLTESQVARIAGLYEDGYSLRQLGAQFGVSDGSIRNYLLRVGVTLRAARRVPKRR